MTTRMETRPKNIKPTPARPGRRRPGKICLIWKETALHELIALVENRSKNESESKASYANAISTAEKELAQARKQIATGKERDLATLNKAHRQTLQQIEERYKSEGSAADGELADTRRRVTSECDEAESQARTTHQDARWTADSVYEAAEKQSTDDREETRRSAAGVADRLAELWQKAEGPLARAGLERDEIEVPASQAASGLIVEPGAHNRRAIHGGRTMAHGIAQSREC